MLRIWLRLDPSATWGKLVDAIHFLDVTVVEKEADTKEDKGNSIIHSF